MHQRVAGVNRAQGFVLARAVHDLRVDEPLEQVGEQKHHRQRQPLPPQRVVNVGGIHIHRA